MPKQVYMICPVRGVTPDEQTFLDGYVSRLEVNGTRVHYPPRDVNQEDPTGLRILSEHRAAMKKSKAAHIYWNGKSSGSFFDLGMAFMARVPVVVANPQMIPDQVPTLEDLDIFLLSLPGVMALGDSATERVIGQTYSRMIQIIRQNKIEYNFTGLDKNFLFDFGMAFATEKPIMLLNREEVEKQRTPHKSFQNVLLELDILARTS